MATEIRSTTGNPVLRLIQTRRIAHAHPEVPVVGPFAMLNTFRRGAENILENSAAWIDSMRAQRKVNFRKINLLPTLNPDAKQEDTQKMLHRILDINPHIAADLEASHNAHPSEVSMAVIFTHHPIVFARFANELVALLSDISCTKYAINRLEERLVTGAQYTIAVSSNKLIPDILKHIEERDEDVDFCYSLSMDPEDYISLAVHGYLQKNERRIFNLQRKN